MNIIQKLFCKHKNKKEIGRYYIAWEHWDFPMSLIPETFLEPHVIYVCEDCGKETNKKLFTRYFVGWNDNKQYQEVIEKLGYLPKIDFILRKYAQ